VNAQGPRAIRELLVHAVPDLRDRLDEARIRRAWPTVVGPDVARRSRPQGLTQGCLHVVVDNSPWLQELTLRAGDLTARVAAQFPVVRALRFSLGRVEDDAATTASPARPIARALDAEDLRSIEAAVAPIRDPDVRAAARRLLGTARRFGPQRGAV
jgi:hypothetical protein